MIGDLVRFIPEQRALYAAEQRVDLAETDLFACVKDPRRAWAARKRYREALQELHRAKARLEKLKCDLAGRRHLRVVQNKSITESTSD